MSMPGPSGKPDGSRFAFTLNQGFKGYSPRRHLGDLHSALFYSILYSWHIRLSDMTSEMHQRKKIRKQIRQLRNSLSLQQQQLAAEKVLTSLLLHPKIQAAQHISLFISFDGEINTRPIIEALWQQKKSIYLPVLHPFSRGNLLFLRYTPQTPMLAHPFGLIEPKLNVNNVLPCKDLDVIITPMVAFDAEGNRLGMGGGYYDRTLKNWQRNETYPIGIAHDCQQAEKLPHESWDIPLPEIITPSKIWRW